MICVCGTVLAGRCAAGLNPRLPAGAADIRAWQEGARGSLFVTAAAQVFVSMMARCIGAKVRVWMHLSHRVTNSQFRFSDSEYVFPPLMALVCDFLFGRYAATYPAGWFKVRALFGFGIMILLYLSCAVSFNKQAHHTIVHIFHSCFLLSASTNTSQETNQAKSLLYIYSSTYTS